MHWPEMVCVAWLVMNSFTGERIFIVGAVVSTLNVALTGTDSFPSASLALIFKLWVPSSKFSIVNTN